MRVLPSFDPSNTSNTFVNVGSGDPGCKILMYNQSIVTVKLDFQDGNTAILHAGEANYWILENVTPYIIWSQYSILNAVSSASSQITCTLYNPDEEITGTYPMSLVYQTNIGNTGGINTNTVASNANNITNDGNANGTTIIEATPTGASSSTWLAKTDGTLTVQEYVTSVLTTLLQILPGASTAIKLAALNRTVEILGSLTVDQNLAVTGTGNVTGRLTAAGLTSSNGLTVSAGGSSVTGNESVSGTLTAAGLTSSNGLTVSGGGSSITGNESVSGTLTAAGITSSSGLTVSAGGASITGTGSVSSTFTAAGITSSNGLTVSAGGASITGLLTAINSILISSGLLGVTAAGDLIDASGVTTYLKGQSAIALQVPNGTGVATFNGNGSRFLNGVIYGTDASNAIISATGTSGTGNTRIQNTDKVAIQVPGGSDVVQVLSNKVTFVQPVFLSGGKNNSNNICGAQSFNGTANSTGVVFNHNYTGTPNYIGITTSSGSSTSTVGASGITSTQVTVYQNSPVAFKGFATFV